MDTIDQVFKELQKTNFDYEETTTILVALKYLAWSGGNSDIGSSYLEIAQKWVGDIAISLDSGLE